MANSINTFKGRLEQHLENYRRSDYALAFFPIIAAGSLLKQILPPDTKQTKQTK